MTTSYGLEPGELAMITAVLAEKEALTKAVLYGSRAMGDFKNYSDIDLAVFGPLDPQTIADIKDRLEELPLPYKFDVLRYEDLTHAGLKDHIDRVGRDLYVRAPERV